MADEKGPQPLKAEALLALARPERIRLWELLDEHGPATAAQLASMSGQSRDEVGDHLSELAGHGIVESSDDDPEPKWHKRSGAFSFQPHHFENDPDTAGAALFLETELIRMHVARLQRWLAVSRTMPLPWREASYDVSVSIRLTRDELAELGARIIDVVKGFHGRTHDDEGDEPTSRIEVFFHAFPIGPIGPIGV